jgi:sortase B
MRFILVARRLRDGEIAGDWSTIQRSDEYIQKQKEKEKTTKEKS